jgi:hypothetical protein
MGNLLWTTPEKSILHMQVNHWWGKDIIEDLAGIRGDFDVLTLESSDTREWAVAMATLDKHPCTVKGQHVSLSYYSILPGRMGRPDLVEKALPRQMVLAPEGPASRLPHP